MTLACSECITGDDKTCKRCEGQAMTDDIMTRVREWLASCVRVATENGVPEEADLEAAALAFIDGEPARMAAAREEQREACASVVLRDSLPNAREALRDAIRNTPLAATPLADEIAALRRERDEMKSAAERWLRQRDLSFDREEALSARVAELEADLEVGRETCRRHGTTSDTGADAWSASKLIGFLSHNLAGKASAVKDACAVLERYTVERDALRAQLLSERERLERWLTAPDGKQYERGTVQAVFDECDALRAQVGSHAEGVRYWTEQAQHEARDAADLRATCAMLRAQVEAARTYARQALDYGEDCDANDLLRAMDEAKP